MLRGQYQDLHSFAAWAPPTPSGAIANAIIEQCARGHERCHIASGLLSIGCGLGQNDSVEFLPGVDIGAAEDACYDIELICLDRAKGHSGENWPGLDCGDAPEADQCSSRVQERINQINNRPR